MIPLHRLPKRASDIVLRNMTTMNQFLLSLYYNHLKSRIKSLNLGVDLKLFKIIVGRKFEMCIIGPDQEWLVFTFNGNDPRREGEPKRVFTENDLCSISYDDDWEYGWSFEAQKSGRQCILLIMEVFNLKKIDDLAYEKDDYCFDSIREMLKGIQLERLNIIGDEAERNYEEILKTIPISTHLVLETNPGTKFHNVLLQNFESLTVILLNFSEILIINSKFLRISGENFTMKNMNMFLKMWRKGCNPNAKNFYIHTVPTIPDNDDVMNVLKGIPFDTVPETIERSFLKFPYLLPATYGKVHGDYDIKRMTDGQRATVKLHRGRGWFSFDLFVWDD